MQRNPSRLAATLSVALLLLCGLAFAAASWARPASTQLPVGLLGHGLPAFEAWGSTPIGTYVAEHVATRLELTDAQRNEIRELIAARGPEIVLSVRAIKDRRVVLFQAIHQHPPIEDDIRDASADLAVAQTELALLRADLVDDVHGVLTPEQQAQLVEMKQNLLALVESVTEGLTDRLAARLAA